MDGEKEPAADEKLVDRDVKQTNEDLSRYLDEDAAPDLAVKCVQLEYLRQIRDALLSIGLRIGRL